MAYQEPKGFEASLLRKGTKTDRNVFNFHMSIIMDILIINNQIIFCVLLGMLNVSVDRQALPPKVLRQSRELT